MSGFGDSANAPVGLLESLSTCTINTRLTYLWIKDPYVNSLIRISNKQQRRCFNSLFTEFSHFTNYNRFCINTERHWVHQICNQRLDRLLHAGKASFRRAVSVVIFLLSTCFKKLTINTSAQNKKQYKQHRYNWNWICFSTGNSVRHCKHELLNTSNNKI